jgi:hypothetical protein
VAAAPISAARILRIAVPLLKEISALRGSAAPSRAHPVMKVSPLATASGTLGHKLIST